MGQVKDQIIWALHRRYRVAKAVKNFWASPLSYVDHNSRFAGFNSIYEHAVVGDSSLGLFTYVAFNSRVMNCSVGRYCSIGPGTLVGGLGTHPTGWISTHPVFYSSGKQAGGTNFAATSLIDELPRVSIGNDVWIGARAIVLDGCSVGDGAIIAAGALVTKDVEPYSIVGGVPAKIIRMRFDAPTIEKLLKIKWWDWPVEKLRPLSNLFQEDGSTMIDKLMTHADQ